MANEIVIKPVVDPSLDKLKLLHPAIRDSAILAYKNARKRTPANVRPVINETIRSFDRQNKLYQQGRTTKGSIVTNSKGGQSIHQYGLALDFYLLINGKDVWDFNNASWKIVIDCFKEQGFESGADWKKFKDYPHLQKPMGNTWRVCFAKYKSGNFIAGTDYVNIHN